MVKFVVGLVVLQTLHSVPLTLPIGLPELPDEHLGERKRSLPLISSSLMLGPRAPGDPSSTKEGHMRWEESQDLLKLITAV